MFKISQQIIWLLRKTLVRKTRGAVRYMGVEKAGTNWYLLDGTNLGNSTISNSDPYKHWRYDFYARVGALPG